MPLSPKSLTHTHAIWAREWGKEYIMCIQCSSISDFNAVLTFIFASVFHCNLHSLYPLSLLGVARPSLDGEPSSKKPRMDGAVGMMFTPPLIRGMGPPMVMPGMAAPILPGMPPPGVCVCVCVCMFVLQPTISFSLAGPMGMQPTPLRPG